MAAKEPLWRCMGHMILSLVLVVACGIVLLPLQHVCMGARNKAFVDGYCLSDNNMRTVLAAIITVAVMGLGALLTSTVCAFRMSRLQGGIQEGVSCIQLPESTSDIAPFGVQRSGSYVPSSSDTFQNPSSCCAYQHSLSFCLPEVTSMPLQLQSGSQHPRFHLYDPEAHQASTAICM